MSNFLYHEACPACGSSDANAVFDDGHKFCFSCKITTPAGNRSLDEVERSLKEITTIKDPKELPSDFTFSIPKEPFLWLQKYSLTKAELIHNKIGWSNERQMLIFPYYGEEGTVIFWQGRYFPTRQIKCFTSGDVDSSLIFVGHDGNDTCVIVEDPVSAIKVARVCTSLPLFGSHISLKKIMRIRKYFPKIVFWLDFDKTKDMIKFQERYRYLFDSIKIVASEKDPKEYSTEEIKEFLNG